MEENLLGHLLKANDLGTSQRVTDSLSGNPSTVHDLARLRSALAPLAADKEEFEPPPDLWVRAVARVAEHVVATEGRVGTSDGRVEQLIQRAAAAAETPRTMSVAPAKARTRPARQRSEISSITPSRWNVIGVIALSIAFLALVFPAIMHVRAKNAQIACQDSMRQFHQVVVGYSDAHRDQFPQVGDGERVATVVDTLRLNGYLPDDGKLRCPGGPGADGPVLLANYAYTLGFRDAAGTLHGIVRNAGTDMIPILADAPLRGPDGAVPMNHRHGQNVLFAGGNVRFCPNSLVGPNDDDIYSNRLGRIGAGIDRNDSALGRLEDRP